MEPGKITSGSPLYGTAVIREVPERDKSETHSRSSEDSVVRSGQESDGIPKVDLRKAAELLSHKSSYKINAPNLIWDLKNRKEENIYTPMLDREGNIYAQSDDGRFYAVDPEGREKWSISVEGRTLGQPVPENDGTISTTVSNGKVYALDCSGHLKWKFETKGEIEDSVAVSDDGSIYVGSSNEGLFALDKKGKAKWHFDGDGFRIFGMRNAFSNDRIITRAIVDKKGNVIVGTYDGKGYSVDKKGRQNWVFQAPSPGKFRIGRFFPDR